MNELLHELTRILRVLRINLEATLPTDEPTSDPKPEPKKAPVKKAAAKKKPTAKKEEAPADADDFEENDTPIDDGELTLDDVRSALMAVKEAHSKETALEIIGEHADGGTKLADIPEESYRDVVNACNALDAD